jgi:hypothetical protein
MSTPRLLDLFCGAGGCARGYQMAGFHVTGVDIKPQPRYAGDVFIQGDALAYCREHGHEFDVIHASPPCQRHVSGLREVNRTLGRDVESHADLVQASRMTLEDVGIPWVIENVEGAPLSAGVRLCGSSFGLPIRRHRRFQSSQLIFGKPCHHSWQTEKKYWTSYRKGDPNRRATVVQVYGAGGETEQWGPALGIDWMMPYELTQAIPPAYTHWIGNQLMQAIAHG